MDQLLTGFVGFCPSCRDVVEMAQGLLSSTTQLCAATPLRERTVIEDSAEVPGPSLPDINKTLDTALLTLLRSELNTSPLSYRADRRANINSDNTASNASETESVGDSLAGC